MAGAAAAAGTATLDISPTNPKVTVIDFHTDSRWDSFLESRADALFYHHSAWLSALEKESGQKCLCLACETPAGELNGVLPFLRTRGLPIKIGENQIGRRLSSLPRTPIGGPLAVNEQSSALLVRAAIEHARAEDREQLQIKTRAPLPKQLLGTIAETSWLPTYVVSLPQDAEQLRFGDSHTRHNLKWGVNKAVRQGVTVMAATTENELRSWYELYLTNMRRIAIPPRPYRFFSALWHASLPSNRVRLLLAMQKNGSQSRLVAGSIFLMLGDTVLYAFNGCAEENFSFHPNDLILWTAVHDACDAGFRRFDLGEVPEERPELTRFKTKWGAEPVPQYRYYYPFPDPPRNRRPHDRTVFFLREKLWTRLPVECTRKLGEWLYRWL